MISAEITLKCERCKSFKQSNFVKSTHIRRGDKGDIEFLAFQPIKNSGDWGSILKLKKDGMWTQILICPSCHEKSLERRAKKKAAKEKAMHNMVTFTGSN